MPNTTATQASTRPLKSASEIIAMLQAYDPEEKLFIDIWSAEDIQEVDEDEDWAMPVSFAEGVLQTLQNEYDPNKGVTFASVQKVILARRQG